MRSRLAVLFLLLLMLPFASAEDKPWMEVRSPNFDVITDAGEKRGRDTALRFEQMRAAFGRLMNRQDVINPAVPLQILAFRNNKELKQVLPLWKGKPISAAGVFLQGQDRNFIAIDLSSDRNWEILFHEYAHMLLNTNFVHTGLWFDEGFAEYYSTIRITDKEVVLGAPPEEAADTIRYNSWIPVEQLFAVQHDSKIYNETSDARGMFYIESWAVVHYLFDTQQLAQCNEYFKLVNEQHVAVAEAIERAFGMPPKRLDTAIHDRLFGKGVTEWTFPVSSDPKLREAAVTPLDSLDEQAAIADMHLHSAEYGDKAIQEFKAILQVDPKHAAALRGIGYAYLRKNNLDEAAGYFQQAAALDSKDPRVHYYYALLLFRRGPQLQASDYETMETELKTALALDPTVADVYYLLGFAQMSRRESAAAIASFQSAVHLNPREDRYALGLAQAYMSSQQFDKAAPLLAQVASGSDPVLASEARRAQDFLERSRAVPPDRSSEGNQPLPWGSRPEDSSSDSKADTGESESPGNEPTPAVDQRPIKFAYGQLTSVDCGNPPSAVLTVVIGAKPWKMYTPNRNKLVLLGVDAFSCDWKNQKVLVNYRPGGNVADADLVSLEVQ